MVIDSGAQMENNCGPLGRASNEMGRAQSLSPPFRIDPFSPLASLFCIVRNQLEQFCKLVLFLNSNCCMQLAPAEIVLSRELCAQLRNQLLSALFASLSHLANLKQTSSREGRGVA